MEQIAWHALSPAEAMQQLDTCAEGLTTAEAQKRRERYGENTIRGGPRVTPARLFFSQFTSPLISILLLAAGISFATGHVTDGWVILTIVLLNAVIGFFQEYRAERALAALRALAAPKATVLRDGEAVEIATAQLVPGDITILSAGDRVPADARLLEAANLQSEEAALTGDSQPVPKHVDATAAETALSERYDMLYLGTSIVSGRAEAVVVCTGMDTVMGGIARDVQAEGISYTPLQRKLAELGKRLGGLAVLLAFLLILVGLARRIPLTDLIFTGIAAAVAFIPEGLPAVVTVVLAVGVQRMVRRNAIIRKLPAVEALGSATFICTDKTGTLTKNEMTVRALWLPAGELQVEGEGYEPRGGFRKEEEPITPDAAPGLKLLLRAGALCNDARLRREGVHWSVTGDPTEGAILVAAAKAGLHPGDLNGRYPRLDEIPFDPDQRYMATLHAGPDEERWLFLKGAPERLLPLCDKILSPGSDAPDSAVPLDDTARQAVCAAQDRLAADALRVLAVAGRILPAETAVLDYGLPKTGLVFFGLVGMIDPARPEAVRAIAAAHRAGIRVMMITGDHPLTARAIAEQLGLLESGCEVVEGNIVAAMSEEELARRVEHIAACARAEPSHKLRIVKALQQRGHIVAMTGDGINDAPALKRADIGVAMGITGTDVAKEASEMVLADDNFASIVSAVEEGRVIFSNIRRVVVYLLATNSGEILTLLLTLLSGLPLPLLPVQILWINLVTDGAPTIALGQEPPHGQVLDRPPRPPNAPLLPHRLLLRIAFAALFMAAGTMWIFATARRDGIEYARTLAFVAMALYQLFNVYNARSLDQSLFRIGFWTNPWVTGGVLGSAALLVVAVHVGFLQRALQTVPLTLGDWGKVTLIASGILIAEEIRKAVAPSLFGADTANGEQSRPRWQRRERWMVSRSSR